MTYPTPDNRFLDANGSGKLLPPAENQRINLNQKGKKMLPDLSTLPEKEMSKVFDVLNAAIAWKESHPKTDKTVLLSGYLYDRVRRLNKKTIELIKGAWQ